MFEGEKSLLSLDEKALLHKSGGVAGDDVINYISVLVELRRFLVSVLSIVNRQKGIRQVSHCLFLKDDFRDRR